MTIGLKRTLWGSAAVLTACIAGVVTCNVMVLQAAKGKMYDRVEDVPHRRVALLLGTSPIGRNGRPNQFFLRRIDATVKLWKAGKFDRLFISGGNFEGGYNKHHHPRWQGFPNHSLHGECKTDGGSRPLSHHLATLPQ